jgi:sortase (surface protein transpeptidase)
MALNIEYVTEHHPGRWIILILIVLILGTTGWFGYKWYTTGLIPFPLPITIADRSVDESSITTTQINNYKVSSANPRYIQIPLLHISDTRISPEGLSMANLPELPDNINDTGWYTKSGTPGDGGVVLIDGYNLGINKNGSFNKINTLQKGNKIIIENGGGDVFSYSVIDTQSMAVSDFTTSGMALLAKPANANQEGLNLMTFDGVWVPKLGTFSRRTIVRAVLDVSDANSNSNSAGKSSI